MQGEPYPTRSPVSYPFWVAGGVRLSLELCLGIKHNMSSLKPAV